MHNYGSGSAVTGFTRGSNLRTQLQMKNRTNLDPAVFGLLLLIGFVAYATILNSFFLSDDFAQIGKVLEGDYSVAWGLEHGGFFRPLFILSYIADSKLWATNPFGYHVTNVALHVVNSYLVFTLASRLTETKQDSAAISGTPLMAALIFLLHPSHTEAVTWISGRADLLATLFSLASLVFYEYYRRTRRMKNLGAALLCFVVAMLAKESAICVPLLILVLEIVPESGKARDTRVRQALKVIALFGLTLSIYLLVRYWILGKFVGGYGARQHLDFKLSLLWERLPKFFVRALLPPFPDQLSFMFFKPLKSAAFIAVAGIFVSLALTVIFLRHTRQPAAIRREHNKRLLLLLVMFLGSLLPVITAGISVFDSSGERFLYLPSVFSAITVAFIASSVMRKPKRAQLVIFCLLIFYAGALLKTNQRWREASRLTGSILKEIPVLTTHDDVFILNVPDNIRGVPVYRNGLGQAVKHFQVAKTIGNVTVVSTHSLQSVSDDMSIKHQASLFSIYLSNERDEFSRINYTAECVQIVEASRRLLSVNLKSCNRPTDVLYFHGGMSVFAPEKPDLSPAVP